MLQFATLEPLEIAAKPPGYVVKVPADLKHKGKSMKRLTAKEWVEKTEETFKPGYGGSLLHCAFCEELFSSTELTPVYIKKGCPKRSIKERFKDNYKIFKILSCAECSLDK